MKINFYSPNRIEPWDHKNVYEQGIGGSETSHVEMAVRLAKRGHEVTSYTKLPSNEYEWANVKWRDVDSADLNEDALWIVYRHPETGANLTPTENRKYWLVCQDIWYPNYRTKDAANFERIIGLCPRHISDMKYRDPTAGDRICMSSNGVNVERFEQIENQIALGVKEPIERVPHRLIWASSPDRGLKEILDIFVRAREEVPELELHVFYGMDNIYKVCNGDKKKMPWAKAWRQYERALDTENVVWRGRIGQDQLAVEWMTAGIWCYPTWFQETSCIACMEAQCGGAIPITNPIWATGHNVKHGVFIEGEPSDKLVLARYVDAVVRIASNPTQQSILRSQMISESRQRLSWERFVDQWEEWMVDATCTSNV